MTRHSTGNLKTCIYAAKQFLEVAEMIVGDVRLIRPFFVNAGLSCELFLKAIQMIENSDNTFCTGHNLNDLFSGISEAARISITNIYDGYCLNGKVGKDLNTVLSDYPNPFVDFRYTFERSAEGNIFALAAFANSLQAFTETISPFECEITIS